MPPNTALQHISNIELAVLCERETSLYFRQEAYDPAFCLELFRRAFKDGDQDAWRAICDQYTLLVRGWVKGHSGFARTYEDADYFVNGAFGKIFTSLTPTKFDSFPSLAAILNYLRACTVTIIIDYNRATARLELDDLEQARRVKASDPTPEILVSEQTDNHQLWEWVNGRLQDDKERLVMEELFVMDIKPRALYDRHKNEFTDVAEIYRIKQNILARLSRDEGFKRRFTGD